MNLLSIIIYSSFFEGAKERSKVPLDGIPHNFIFLDAGKALAEINALDGFPLRIPLRGRRPNFSPRKK